jgi:hypothetical protein
MSKPLLIKARYRNKLEARVGDQLDEAGVSFDYEPHQLSYLVPSRHALYTPDFRPKDKQGKHLAIILETKGYFIGGAKERQKYILFRDSNPTIDLRFVFSDASKPIYKGSKTTYAKWAKDNGFKFADKGIIPQSWIREMKGKQ